MKIRSGFVSNSSSSSFIIVGKRYDLSDKGSITRCLEAVGIPQESIDECINAGYDDREHDDEYFDYYDANFEGVVGQNIKDLSVILSSESQCCYLGKAIFRLPDIYNITPETRKSIADNLNVSIDDIDLHFGEIHD